MAMKKLAIAALFGLLLGGGAQAAESVTFGFSLDSKDSTLQTAWEDYMKSEGKAQGKAAGLDVKWVMNVANNDPARQAANIEDLITAGVDVIIARTMDAGAIGASITAAKNAKTPFITFDRASSTVKPAAHVGGDSYDEAYTTGIEFANLLKSKGVKGKCILLEGSLTDSNAINRTKGWNDSTGKVGGIETIIKVPTEWNPQLFLSGLSDALSAHPEANCIYAESDFAFPSIQAALEKAGRWYPTGNPKHVWLATSDLLTAAIEPMEKGYIDVSTTWDALSQAREAVRVAIALKKGQDPKCGAEGCLAKGRVVTPATIKSTPNLWSRDYK